MATNVNGGELTLLDNITRTAEFWKRACGIYMGYKVTQLRAFALKLAGWKEDRLVSEVWTPQQERAAEQMYSLCVDLRGFYLKTGQFLGARGDFVPEQICRKLSLLHDQVPPMPASQVREVIENELGGVPLETVFAWIDLDQPLGSASISQVHKAKLHPLPKRSRRGWSPLNAILFLPISLVSDKKADSKTARALAPPPVAPVDLKAAWKHLTKEGVVAVKVQYPNALPTMSLDLSNLRLLSAFLSKTELKFDMLSAVDELAKQIRLEFDFCREARIMDAVADQFQGLQRKIRVPRSVPTMVTPRLLVMNFIDGVPITRLRDARQFQNLSEATKKIAAHRILSRVSEAYGRMVLMDGLFQADGHPGNILVMKGGRIGLIDYGQSKRLPDEYRASFARLILKLGNGKPEEEQISKALDELGVVTERDDTSLKAQMARGMFDTSGTVNPFDPESPIKKMGIEKFPADMFFVLRVVQLLRGLADGMGVKDFSCAKQWRPFARNALRELGSEAGVSLPCASVSLTAFSRPL